MKKTILILLILNAVFLPAETQIRKNLHFDHLTVSDGLSQNTVNDIYKDSKGFMWIGTNDGLNRYDGYTFKTYQFVFDDSTSLSNNRVYEITEDKDGHIWVGTKGGLNRYNPATDDFTRYLNTDQIDSPLTNNFVRALLCDSKGNLWIGTLGGGLHVLLSGTEKVKWIHPKSTGPDRNRLLDLFITDISEDKDGEIWVATHSRGINKLNQKRNMYLFFPLYERTAYTEEPAHGKTIFHVDEERIWVCTEGEGLFHFNEKNKTSEHYFTGAQEAARRLKSDIVKDIIKDREGNIWVATDGGGLHIVNHSNGEIDNIMLNQENPEGLNSNAIYSLYLDDQDIFWIGTFTGGINILDEKRTKFKTFTQEPGNQNSLSHRSVLCFTESHDGKIWIGTDGGGLNLFDPSEQVITRMFDAPGERILSSNVVTSLMLDKNQALWVGTYNGGINILKNDGGITRFIHAPEDSSSLRNNNVWAIHEDKNHYIWIGTSEGLHRYNPKKSSFTFIEPPTYFGSPFLGRITNIFEDSSGKLWFGGAHIYNLDSTGNKLMLAKLDPIISSRIQDFEIRTIYQDTQKRLWIATEGRGVVMYNKLADSIRFYNTNDGLPNNSVHRILEDHHGHLWLSTNKGISRLNPAINEFRNYDMNDGLQSNQFSYSAAMKSSKGELYFGGINGFNYFHPDSIQVSTFIPPVRITDFRLFNKSVDIHDPESPYNTSIGEVEEIVLKHSQSVITFEFTSLNYRSPERNQYKIKLDGFDDDWRLIGNQRTATYTNLDPGNYIFRVRGSNNDLFWNDLGDSVRIKVLPPWWKTIYAYIGYFTIILLILYGYQHTFLKQAQLKHDLEIKNLEQKKSEELKQMELRFFTNISHEFKTPLTLIKGPLEQILADESIDFKTGKRLLMMRSNVERLLRLINQLMDFRKANQGSLHLSIREGDLVAFVSKIKEAFDELARSRSINYIFQVDAESMICWFDPDKIEKVIYNLLSNAFKYTPQEGEIKIKLGLQKREEEQSQVYIAVIDTGIGIPKDKQEKIFERFFQVEDKSLYRTATESSTGIGLSFSKTLIENHHGSIHVESFPGQGSLFSITFPVEKSAYQLNEFSESTSPPSVSLKQELITREFSNTLQETDIQLFESSENLKRRRILIVEDNMDVLNFIKDITEKDFEISLAKNGHEGLEKAKKDNPDIIVSDIMMPEMDGLEMCTKIRNDSETCHIPIIILTAKGDEQDKLEGLRTGASDYISKPFNPNELLQKLKNIIYNRDKTWEKFRKSDILEPADLAVTSFDEKFLENAVKAVEDQIDNPDFDVTMLVESTGMSRSVLYRKLKVLTGQSANEFINTIKLKRAAQLLNKNKFSISEITYMVGYNDPQYFSKCFKKQYGKTPSQYAKQ